ncbi:MAG: hypothetical protein FJ146_08255 [Deltaproteobacteria bacterium]|nr:hypothetical protein [Deltaproteobacteria bacterium]
MIAGRSMSRLRVAVPLVLLVVILMRLVWLQLRHYPLQYSVRGLAVSEVVKALSGRDCLGSRQLVYTATPILAVSPDIMERERIRPIRSLALKEVLAPLGYDAVVYGVCRWGQQVDAHLLSVNKILLVSTIFLATLMTRFICSSWTVALVVAGMLLSRGRLQSSIGTLSPDYLAMFGFTLWLTALAHFLRTGAIITALVAVAAATLAMVADRSLISLFLCFPLVLIMGFLFRRQIARPVVKRLRVVSRRQRILRGLDRRGSSNWSEIAEHGAFFSRATRSLRWFLGLEFPPVQPPGWRLNFKAGGLFRTLSIPFLLWAYWRRRWLRWTWIWLASGTLIGGVLLLAVGLLLGTESIRQLEGMAGKGAAGQLEAVVWWWHGLSFLDTHLAASLLVLIVCATVSPAAGLPSFFEWSWLNLVTLVIVATAGFMSDLFDFQLLEGLFAYGDAEPWLLGLEPRGVSFWVEPAVLSFGVAGIYNLLKAADSQIA